MICICESWTHEDHTKAFLEIDGYSLVCRRDREDTSAGFGGGLLMYVKLEICAPETQWSNMKGMIT